jgi:hypothetical protein
MFIKFTKEFRGYKVGQVVKVDSVIGGRYLGKGVAVEVDESEYTKAPCKGCGDDEPCKDCEEKKEDSKPVAKETKKKRTKKVDADNN